MLKVLGGVCLAVATAHADPEAVDFPRVPPVPPVQTARGVWLDVGDSYGHVIAQHDRLRTQSFYFAPHLLLSRLFYVGAEISAGMLTGTGVLPSDGIAEEGFNPTPQMDMVGALAGEVVAVRAVGGARAFLGPVSGSGELALGVQDAMVSAKGAVAAAANVRELVGLRGRIDYWATSWFTVGATVGIDALEPGDFSVGLGLGVHVEPYDGSRR